MQITLVSSGDTVSDVLNRFQTEFCLNRPGIAEKISRRMVSSILEILLERSIRELKAMTNFLATTFTVVDLDTPKRNSKVSLADWIAVVLLSAREMAEASEAIANSPAAHAQNEEISEASLEVVSACAEVLDDLPAPIFDILLLADDCYVKERVAQIPPYLIDRAGNLFQKTAGNAGFLPVYVQMVSKHLSNIAVSSGLTIKLMAENLEVSEACICGDPPPFIVDDRGGVYKRDRLKVPLAVHYAQVISEYLSNIVVVL